MICDGCMAGRKNSLVFRSLMMSGMSAGLLPDAVRFTVLSSDRYKRSFPGLEGLLPVFTICTV